MIQAIKLPIFLTFTIVCGQEKFVTNGLNSDESIIIRNYHNNGKLKEEGKKIGTTKIGLWTYWNEDGRKYITENYIEGKRDGLQISWQNNGQVSIENQFKKGLKDGFFTAWYDNGNKKQTGQFVNGLKDGMMSYWYDTGGLWMQEYYSCLLYTSDAADEGWCRSRWSPYH